MNRSMMLVAIVLLALAGLVNIALVRGSMMFWVNAALIFGAIVYILYRISRPSQT